jgi:hypothetical protein
MDWAIPFVERIRTRDHTAFETICFRAMVQCEDDCGIGPLNRRIEGRLSALVRDFPKNVAEIRDSGCAAPIWHIPSQLASCLRIWQAGLAEYDGMQGIAWEWQPIDGAIWPR